MIEIRKACSGDKVRIEEISSNIWDGDDYLPRVFDKWVKDPEGEFSVIEYDGKVVGCSKITQLPDRVLWLEGIRMDIEYRGLGLGKRLAEYQLQRAKEIGYERLELGTFTENVESLAIIEQMGFHKVAEFKFYQKDLGTYEKQRDNYDQVRLVTSLGEVTDIPEMLKVAHRKGYISFDWTFYRLDKDLLQELVDRKALYRWGQTVFAFSDWNQKDDGMTIQFVIGKDNIHGVFDFILDKAKDIGASNVIFMAGSGAQKRALLLEKGFKVETQEPLDVFVYRHGGA